MKNLFILLMVFVGLYSTGLKAQISYSWGNWIGPGGDYVIYRVRLDEQGNSYLCGYFKDQLDLDPSEAEAIIVAEGTSENGFLAKYSPEGFLLWYKVIQSNKIASVGDVVINSLGNVFITCWLQGQTTIPGYGSYTVNGLNDAVIVSYDSNGNFRWAEGLTGSSSAGLDYGIELNTDENGHVYSTTALGSNSVKTTISSGSFVQIMPSGYSFASALTKWSDSGSILYMKGLGASNPKLAVNASGEAYLCFDASQFLYDLQLGDNFGSFSSVIVKINPDGSLGWYNKYSSYANRLRNYGIVTDNEGIFITSRLSGTVDFLTSNGAYDIALMKLSTSNGELSWAKNIGSISSDDEPRDIAINPDGNIIVTGFFRDNLDADPSPTNNATATSAGSTDIILWEVDKLGNYLSHYTIGGSNADEGRALSYDSEGNLFLMGYSANLRTGDFDPGSAVIPITTNPAAFAGSFVAKYVPSFNISIGPDISQCGGSVTLTASPPGYNYRWFNGATTQSLTLFNSAQAYVEVYDINNNLIGTDSAVVIIDQSTSAELGADIVAYFETVLEPNAFGDSYLWSTGESTESIVVSESGTYSLEMLSPFGCVLKDTIEVTIKLPAIYKGGVGDGHHHLIFTPEALDYPISGIGDGAYSNSFHASSIDFYKSSPGDGSGLSIAESDILSFFQSDKGDGHFSMSLLGESVSFFTGGIGDGFNQQLVSGLQAFIYVGGEGDGFFNKVRNDGSALIFESGVGDGFGIANFNSLLTAIENKEIQNTLTIYPNPVIDICYLSDSGNLNLKHYEIINASGQVVLSSSFDPISREIDATNLETGVYIVRMDNNSGLVYFGKIMKK